MVALTSQQAEKFLRDPPSGIFVFLFHGSDAGLVSERVRRCIRSLVPDPDDPFCLARLSADDIASDPQRLIDEARTVALFSTFRCVSVDIGQNGQAPGLDALLRDPPPGARIVMSAGSLRRDSALRKLCEQDRGAAAIECQPDGPEDTARLIDQELGQAGFTIAPPARSLLASLLGVDRLLARSELEKLVTYAHGCSEIGVNDISEITAGSSLLGQELAIRAAFDGQMESLASHWAHAVSTGVDAQGVLAGALRYALGIHMRKTRGADPSSWTAAGSRRAIKILSEAVRKSRREPRLANAVALRSLWSIADLAKRQAS